MRERIAMRLVELYMQNDGPLDGLTEADAVLDELMTPTEGMLEAGSMRTGEAYTAMIKAAKEGK